MLTNRADWPADPVFGGLFSSLDPQRMLEILRRHLVSDRAGTRPNGGRRADWTTCRVIEALYDPGAHVRVAYVLLNDESVANHRAWPEGDIVYVRYPVRDPMSRRGTVLSVDGFDLEVYRFPNDRRLRGLRKFSHRDTAAATWQRWLRQDEPAIDLDPDTVRRALMRYVPEQKWIVHLRAKCRDNVAQTDSKRAIAVRSADAESCQRIHDRTLAVKRALHLRENAFRVPKPVALDTKLGLLAVQWSWGRSLVETLASREPSDIMRRVAGGLHALHQCSIDGLPLTGLDDQLATAQQCVDDIATVLPSLKDSTESLLDALRANTPTGSETHHATIHNDFHWNQLRIKRDRLTVLDFERAAIGDPLIDIAQFVTQLDLLSHRPEMNLTPKTTAIWARSFLNEWATISDDAVERAPMRWYCAIARLVLARGMLRHLRPGWPDLVHTCIDRAAEWVPGRNNMEIVA